MTPTRRRVVITGMGCMTGAGTSVEALWRSARDGVSGVKPLELAHPRDVRIKFASWLPDFKISDHFAQKRGTLDRFAALALVAAEQAVIQSGIGEGTRGARCGVIVGSGIGGSETYDEGSHAFYVSGARPDPMTIPKVMPNAAASQISMRFGAQGPTFCISTACSSSSQSLGMAMHMVRAGVIDVAIAGGAEALLTGPTMRAWELLRVLTPDRCRPFSKGRNGMVLGEGAAIFVLETLDAARARGATVLAELAGYGTTSDAGDLLRPNPAIAAAAMKLAIEDAGLTPGDVGYVNAHGTATVANDAAESQALAEVFGERVAHIPVSSTKPIHGHTLGAAGAIELMVTVKALMEQVAPPTLNWEQPDPACAIDAVPNTSRPAAMSAAMSNSFAFGGINASLVVRRAP